MTSGFMWDASYHSGMSARGDLKAAVDMGIPVGVVATLLDNAKMFLVLPRHLDAGNSVFIDSGAFAAFQKGETVDWSRVFLAYESVIGMTSKPEGLSIVVPDVIGDQIKTIALWEQHAERVRGWVASGARVIAPLQRGDIDAGSMLDHAKRLFGTKICAGIPSNLEAMTAQDAATLFHTDFHILGRVVVTAELSIKLQALLTNNPTAYFTADANWLRSRIPAISAAATKLVTDGTGRLYDSARTRAVKAVLAVDAYPFKSRLQQVQEPMAVR